jgi:hypothetical protein
VTAVELGPSGRVAFTLVFLASEAVFIATAGARADRSYGFRMFPESSSVSVHLRRRLKDGSVVPLDAAGRWEARDCKGVAHAFAWASYVRPPAPWRLDANIAAPYGVEASLEQVRGALAYVSARAADDCQTTAFVADVTMRKNGGDPVTVTAEAAHGP